MDFPSHRVPVNVLNRLQTAGGMNRMGSTVSFKTYIKSQTPTQLWSLLSFARRGLTRVFRISFGASWGRLVLFRLKLTRKAQISQYFAQNSLRKLQLGAGANSLPGWLNSEAFAPSSFTHALRIAQNYIYLDVCKTFPFSDGSIDYIFTNM
jgi:hypothetical protein